MTLRDWATKTGRKALGKFIYHPVILASVDDDDFGGTAADPRSRGGNQYDYKPVASEAALSSRDFKSTVSATGKKLLEFLRILRMTYGIAQQDHASFKIVRLPRVQEAVGGGQGEDIVRGGRDGTMFARSHRAVGKRQEHQHNGPGLTRGQETPPRVM
jgi:hypothetical protein